MAIKDEYRQQLYEYASLLAENKLREKGKIVDGTKPVYSIYARKSTKGKDRQERSINDQIADCQRVVKDLHITPVKIFKEEESAKTSGKRDKFSEMIEDIKNGKYNSIIAWHPDRLARNMKEAGEIIDLLDKGKIVDLKFATYTFIRDANGIMTLGIQFVLAKQYSDNLSASSSRGSKNIAKEGKSPSKKPKYGYLINPARFFRPDGNNYDLLIQAFRMALDRIGLEQISDFLKVNDFHFRGKPTKMSKQKLSSVFNDPFYAGIYLYGSEIVELTSVDNLFKPMVTPLDFMELRRVTNNAYTFKKRRIKVLLFSKMVTCGYCGNLMSPGLPTSSGKSKNRYLDIRCNNSECEWKLDRSIKRGVRGKVIFDHIVDFLSSGLEVDKEAYENYREEAKVVLANKRGEYIGLIKSLNRQIQNTNSAMEIKSQSLANAKGKLIDELNSQIEELRQERDQLEQKIKDMKEAVTAIDHNIDSELMSYENFLNFFKNLAVLVKNSDNQLLVDKVIRMVFLNFEVKGGKVSKYSLNPDFERYVKIPSVLVSRGAEN